MALAPLVHEKEIDGMRFFAMRTGVKDIVSVEGSVLGGYNMLPLEKALVPAMAASLLDAGTELRSKDELREQLAARGISLTFSQGGDRTSFYGTCLPEQLSFLLVAVAECLSVPTFPQKEIDTELERALAELEQGKTDTNVQANTALMTHLYPKEHANGALTSNEKIKYIKTTTRQDLIDFAQRFGKKGAIVSIVGDVDAVKAQKAVQKAFTVLKEGNQTIPEKKLNTRKPAVLNKFIEIKDKANIDTFMGVPVMLTSESLLYIPFGVLMSMLGGRGISSGHLMRTIRARDGYTYGIRATANGFDNGADGMMAVWATFSPETYTKAVEATRKEISLFFKSFVTEDALAIKKREMIGNYLVGLATTRGMASMLHKIGKEGKSVTYIDTFIDAINAVTVKDLNDAAALIDLSSISLAAAGSKAV